MTAGKQTAFVNVAERYAELNGQRQQRERPANPPPRSEPMHPGCFSDAFALLTYAEAACGPARSAKGYAGLQALAIGPGISNEFQKDRHQPRPGKGLALIA